MSARSSRYDPAISPTTSVTPDWQRRAPSRQVHIPKAAELVAGDLRRQIVHGEIQAGDTLAPEAELMVRFGVSRPTLREAFRILESERLISVTRGARGGARVHLPDIGVAANYAGLLLQVRGTTLADVYQARQFIEPELAGECARRRGDGVLDDLKQCIELEEAAIEEDFKAFSYYTAQFHQLVVDGSGNTTLAVLTGLLLSIFEKHLALEMAAKHTREERVADNRKGLRGHRKLVTLIEEGDAEGAEAFWRRHMEVAGVTLLRDVGSTTVVELLA